MNLRLPHPSRFGRRVGSYALTPLTLFFSSWVHEFRFSIFALRWPGAPGTECVPGSWGSSSLWHSHSRLCSWFPEFRFSIFEFRFSLSKRRDLQPPPPVRHKRTRQAYHKQSQNGTYQDHHNQGPNLRSLYFRAGQSPIPLLSFQSLTDHNGKRVSHFSDTRCLFSTPLPPSQSSSESLKCQHCASKDRYLKGCPLILDRSARDPTQGAANAVRVSRTRFSIFYFRISLPTSYSGGSTHPPSAPQSATRRHSSSR